MAVLQLPSLAAGSPSGQIGTACTRDMPMKAPNVARNVMAVMVTRKRFMFIFIFFFQTIPLIQEDCK
jgi:hypothetical protein